MMKVLFSTITLTAVLSWMGSANAFDELAGQSESTPQKAPLLTSIPEPAAPSMATAAGDCTPTGQTRVELTFGDEEETCIISDPYQYDCGGGEMVERVTEVCQTYQPVTETVIIEQKDEYGVDCSIVRTNETLELVEEAYYEWGEVCTPDSNQCCYVDAWGWYYEYGPETVSFAYSNSLVECRDGSMVVQTVTTKTTTQPRQIVDWQSGGPSGNCDPGVDCYTELEHGFVDRVIDTEVTISNPCATSGS